MKKILYVGGFELPDKGAAAIRVMNNALLFRSCGYDVHLLGVRKDNLKTNDSGSHMGFSYDTIKYPSSLREWMIYLSSFSSFSILEREKPDLVILYDFPGLAILKWRRYCKKKGIKIIGDVTEWYLPTGNLLMKLLRGLDTNLRMRYSHHRLDGMITISSFLYNYYYKSKCILLPPLMDKGAVVSPEPVLPQTLSLVYAGSGGGKNKDRLDYIIDAINSLDHPNLSFKIIGLDEKKYNVMYDSPFRDKWGCITFLGRLEHNDTLSKIINSHFQIFVRPINRVTTAGFPSKLVESFGLGVPVITNKTSNIADYVHNGVNGFLLETGHPLEIKRQLEILLNMKAEDLLSIRRRCQEDSSFDYRTYISEVSLFLKNIIDK